VGALHSVSVAAVVPDDSGRVLVVRRRDNGRWEPPGGVLELGEAILDGLRREVLEETGVAVDPVRLSGVYKNLVRDIVALVFLARQVGGSAIETAESSRVEWWSPRQVAEGMADAYAVRVLDALRADGPAVRSHDGVSLLAGFPGLPA
jgi:ADP-ribose pyrophosphatase YjhB (NUDIX family)